MFGPLDHRQVPADMGMLADSGLDPGMDYLFEWHPEPLPGDKAAFAALSESLRAHSHPGITPTSGCVTTDPAVGGRSCVPRGSRPADRGGEVREERRP
jgi:hypothetical protein